MAELEPHPLPRLPALLCRVGLHFMAWDHPRDGFVCRCRRQFLWAEQIRT